MSAGFPSWIPAFAGMTGGGFRVERLRVSYTGQRILDDTSAEFRAGRMSAIVGPNGAGKSTLVKAMLGLIPIDRGTVTLFGDPVRRHRHRIAYIPQRTGIDWSYPATVAEVIGMGRYPLGRLWRRTNARDRERVREALQSVSLVGLEDRAIGALSGGQQQRVFLARAIAQEAAVVVLDEPFTAIDAVTESLLWQILGEIVQAGKLVIVVHHDLAAVAERFDDVAILSGRMIACGSVAAVFTERNIAAAYRRPRHVAAATRRPAPAIGEGASAMDPARMEHPPTRGFRWIPTNQESDGGATTRPHGSSPFSFLAAGGSSTLARSRGNGEKRRPASKRQPASSPSFPRTRESMPGNESGGDPNEVETGTPPRAGQGRR